ncbi:hypothetical protein SteCoe_16627 [Stentor coeruleus]|uniref:Myb-like DNA-binding domain containing protein n=1 Tax=Stentor coeruleus TaxID=5963 RepID=A0A1R2C0V0_9CILI|nr:hypothetical protein SteCoe_16627 [Stentor coeruleus]
MKDMSRYRKLWNAEEDEKLMQIINENQAKNWIKISIELKKRFSIHRLPKQCRERWFNHLGPKKSQTPWSESEIDLVFKLQNTLGNRWSKISESFPKRTTNSIKNLYYSTIRRNLRRFNKNKKPEDRIEGPLDKLMTIPEIRKIFSMHNSKKKIFRGLKLDESVLQKIKNDEQESIKNRKNCQDLSRDIFIITPRKQTQYLPESELAFDDFGIDYHEFEIILGQEDYWDYSSY